MTYLGKYFAEFGRRLNMNRLLIFVLVLIQTLICNATASDLKTLDEAKAMSVKTNKPILLEFYKDDCEYCSQAAQDAINREDIKQALSRVVQISLNIKQDHGKKLSERYKVGIYFPAFFLLNNQGEIIKRWTGYITAQRFLDDFNNAMSENTTVEQRIARFDKTPNLDDATYLAQYFTDIMDYLPANKYYRQARAISGMPATMYAYEIFQNTANAAWRDTIPFADVIPMADSMLMLNQENPSMLVKTAQIMVRLGRKRNKTDQIAKYLEAAIEATNDSRAASKIKDNILLKSEYALCVTFDTTEAIRLKHSTMPDNWQIKPQEFYSYARWCLEHKVDLEAAEEFCRKAIQMAAPGEFRGKVLNTLALICDEQGKRTEAIEFMQMAIKEDPHNDYYSEKLAEYQGNTNQ
jgi:thioredoxin-related protein